MDIKTISPFLSVSTQIQATDIAAIAKQGFKAIINNRPDKESDDQPLSRVLAEESKQQNIDY